MSLIVFWIFYKEGSWGGAKAGRVSYFGVSRRWAWFTCGSCCWFACDGGSLDWQWTSLAWDHRDHSAKKIIHLHPLCAIFCTFWRKHAICTFIKPNTQTNIAPPDLALSLVSMCNDFCLICTTCKPSVNSKMSLFFADDAPSSWTLSGAKISAWKFEAVVLCWKMLGFLRQRVQVSQGSVRLHRSVPGQH